MKPYLTLLILFFFLTASAQKKLTDSLYKNLNKAKTDTEKFAAYTSLCKYYYISNPDSAIISGQEAFVLAKKNNWENDQAKTYGNIANAYGEMGDYVKAMQYYFKSVKMLERLKDVRALASANNNIGATYIQSQEYKKAIPYLKTAERQLNMTIKTQGRTPKNVKLNCIILENIGENFLNLHQIDSADHYLKWAYPIALKNQLSDLSGPIERDLGEVEKERGNRTGALSYFKKAIGHAVAIQDMENQSVAYLSMANLYHNSKQQDSAEYYAKKALDVAASVKLEQDVLNAGKVLYGFYDEDHNLGEAYKYFKLTTAAKDSLYSQDKIKQLLSLDFEEKQRQRDLAEAELAFQDRVRTWLLISGLAVLLLIVFIFWRSSRQRQKANRLLQQQKDEIGSTLSKLQQAQSQLIQSAKMASLGELTAGIAHEIQNPLNFVNNFSEVNDEMIDELREELKAGRVEDALAIADDIQQNGKKINHHGKRADAIVKGMLQHSRTSSGEKQQTNINAFGDEFFKLSYHGLRAKDASLSAQMITRFDDSLPKINIIQQDLGRVLLNLFNNAFYAVQQKAKTNGENYKPTVTLTTSAGNGYLLISIKDNGVGIPDSLKEKILQPFFTTKPTGEGTGLGLSLSYDIIVKGHNGTLDIHSKEGDGAEFVVKLPMN